MKNKKGKNELTVKGESIERVYTNYRNEKYKVNRRYQRKLVWGIEEKISFVDSIIKSFPVPIILLAEDEKDDDNLLEIIDGMQRLNAIFSFVENEFALSDQYFDLNSMAITKELMEQGILVQRTPIMDRYSCISFTGYEVPISVFEFNAPDDVDEVFRRINSGGRKLSRQELRAAGSLAEFATAVRRISAKVRGDDSHKEVLALNDMKLISVTGKELGYGISVDKVFWVAQGVLSKEDVRQSLDEQLVSEILAYMILGEPPPSRSEYLDDYFGLGITESAQTRFNDVNLAVKKRSVDLSILDFMRIIDILQWICKDANAPLTTLLYPNDAQPRAPRVFQVVFLALHQLIIKENKSCQDISKLIKKMRGSGANITVQEGGRWGAEQRQNSINAYRGVIEKLFKQTNSSDPANIHWISQFENILTQSLTEQAAYDFKQGFITLDNNPKFDDASFVKILQTCVGIANLSPMAIGYVLVGVIDKEATSERVGSLFGVKSMKFNNFFVGGIDHELKFFNKNMDQFYQSIIEKIKLAPISDPLKGHLLRNLKPIRYHDKTVFIFEVAGQDEPSSYDDDFYTREGANLRLLQKKEYVDLIKRFLQKK